MNDDAAKPTTRDHLLLIFAGVFAHPDTFAQVAEFVDDKLASADTTTGVLWSYLSSHNEPNLYDAIAALATASVDDSVLDVLQQLTDAASRSTPRQTVSNARKLARVVVNARRKGAAKAALDAAPLTTLDVETIAREAAQAFPHTTSGIHTLTVDDCTAALADDYTVIPTGFSYVDARMMGLIVGEFHQVPGRTGDGKSSVSYAIIRNQFFANAARHRDDPWWEKFGAEWKQHGRCGRRSELLRPLHAGHDHPEETYLAPRVLWFSLEEPQSQVLARFYCDLLSIDRQAWMTKKKFRANVRETYAREITHINEVLGAGRLTIVDYAARMGGVSGGGLDEQFVEQTLADVRKKGHAWARECAKRDAAEGVARPRLMCVDYAQLINVPDDQAKQEHAVLAKVSTTLRKLGPECSAAMLTTLMLLRDHESNEPSKEQIKGSSQFAQDAARIVVLWPFGKNERRLLQAARSCLSFPSTPDTFDFDAELDKAADEVEAANEAPPAEVIDFDEYPSDGGMAYHLARAEHEMLLLGEKDRFGAPGWRLPLAFTGKFARITEVLPDTDSNGEVKYARDGSRFYTSYREHAEVKAVLKPAKTKQRKDKDD
jgi:replicative DNA helicase